MMKKTVLALLIIYSLLIGCTFAVNAAEIAPPTQETAQTAWKKLTFYYAESDSILATVRLTEKEDKDSFLATLKTSRKALRDSEQALKKTSNYIEQDWPKVRRFRMPLEAIEKGYEEIEELTGESALNDIEAQRQIILNYAKAESINKEKPKGS